MLCGERLWRRRRLLGSMNAKQRFVQFYALNASLELPAGATKSELENAMRGKVVAQTQIAGKYER